MRTKSLQTKTYQLSQLIQWETAKIYKRITTIQMMIVPLIVFNPSSKEQDSLQGTSCIQTNNHVECFVG